MWNKYIQFSVYNRFGESLAGNLDNKIRARGQLGKSALPVEAKHPIILAKNLHIAKLLLQHIHQQVGHGGRRGNYRWFVSRL